MRGIPQDIIYHRHAIDVKMKPVVQKHKRFREDKRQTIFQEVAKLEGVGHVREIQYPEWLEKVVMVKRTMVSRGFVLNSLT